MCYEGPEECGGPRYNQQPGEGFNLGDTERGAEDGNTDWVISSPVHISTTNAGEPVERSDRWPMNRQEEHLDSALSVTLSASRARRNLQSFRGESLWKRGGVCLLRLRAEYWRQCLSFSS